MRRKTVKSCALIFVVSMFLGTVPASSRNSVVPSWVLQQYCNEKYRYCVDLPPSAKTEAHQGDAPNHGVTIELPDSGKLWTYAHWDAALFEETEKAALDRIEIIFREHPDAEVNMARTILAGLSAYRIRFVYSRIQPTTEEIIIAYRKPKDKSKETGIIYEVGMKCTPSTYKVNMGTFESFVNTFQPTEE